MERNIPHVMDIFGRPGPEDKQDVCIYDHSPRSRRRRKDVINVSDNSPDIIESLGGGRSCRKKNFADKENKFLSSNKAHEMPQTADEIRASGRSTYSSRTLTDKDIRHLERHLSMKKTIRKQISRNLAQAFVDDPDNLEKKITQDTSLLHSGTKISQEEQNVLDLLKDSVSEKHHDIGDNDSTREKRISKQKTLPKQHVDNDNKSNSSSIWRMFTSRGKSKR